LIRQGFGGGNTSGPINVAACLTAKGQRIDFEVETFVAHTLRGEGFDASEDGTGRQNLGPIAFDCKGSQAQVDVSGATPTLRAMGHAGSHANAGDQLAVAFDLRGREGGAMPEGPHDTANIRAASGGSSRSYIATRWAVRRLTPLECERLQGFPDGYTDVPYRKRNWTADGPRYKALGNSMAVNAMEWIGLRINLVNGLL
jgi:DNA (cytosine-5)-methyltransferase 1